MTFARAAATALAFGLALLAGAAVAQQTTEMTFYYPIAVGGPITKIVDGYELSYAYKDTSQFPKAELVPTKISGTVPASGDFTLTLSGKVTIHGTTKDVTFDVLGKRDGANLTATATANPTWRFADFGMTAPSVPFRVVSLVDEIKVVVDLVAIAKG